MKKTLIFVMLAAMLTACATTKSAPKEPVSIAQVETNELKAPEYGKRSAPATAAAKGANEFALKLSAELIKQNGNENFLCSPYSVWLPLAALVNATDEANRDALLTALGAADISVEDLNTASSRMLYDLTKQRDKEYMKMHDMQSADPLKIANAIFVDNKVTLKNGFAQTFMDYYRGSVMSVDFTSNEAVDAVNKWASENTDGLIDNIIDKFNENDIAAVANAIYFSDRWDDEFNEKWTKKNIFYSPTGETKANFMVRGGDNQIYYEDDKVQAMPLKFKTGGGMYIILPKDGDAVGLLSSMTTDYFDEIQRDSIFSTGELYLPRFTIESGVMSLKDSLTALGVPLFDAKAAPLTVGLIEENVPVWLSDAVHKAVIKVDESGTTAAAVTVLEAMSGKAMPEPTEPFEMNCNKPFVFILYGNTYDSGSQILFTGVVNQPM